MGRFPCRGQAPIFGSHAGFHRSVFEYDSLLDLAPRRWGRLGYCKTHSLPPNISHSSVKMAKERHLISKNIKEDLQQLAEQRFQRARETSTERVIAMIRMWAERTYLFPRLVFDCIYLIVDTFVTYCAHLHDCSLESIYLFYFSVSLCAIFAHRRGPHHKRRT